MIESHTQPGDIVLDFHLGSGTTDAVAHKMGGSISALSRWIILKPLRWND
ncbi:DNA methyltransferase [Spirabiliibacterium mucosae]